MNPENVVAIPDDFVTIDIETTGLDQFNHNILEIAYVVGDQDVETIHFPWWFTVWASADPRALTVNKWFEREAVAINQGVAKRAVKQWLYGKWDDVPLVNQGEYGQTTHAYATLGEYADTQHNEEMKWRAQMNKFLKETQGKTLVGAALTFDVKFIEAFMHDNSMKAYLLNEKFEPNHRLWDVQMYAAGKYSWDKAKSLKETISAVDPNYDYVTRTDHTAAGDVEATRRLFRVLTGRV